MNGDEPGGDDIDELVQKVGVGDAVDSGVDGEDDEENAGDVAEAKKALVSLI